jgi:hypothetical protein
MPYLKRLIPIALVVLVVLVVWGAIWWWWHPSNQSVDVTLEVAANAPALGLRDVTVVVGGDKTGWAEIKRGQTVNASFHPAPDSVPELTLLYQLMAVSGTPSNNEQQSWRGLPSSTPSAVSC